jgi:hypothetical protein
VAFVAGAGLIALGSVLLFALIRRRDVERINTGELAMVPA